MYDTKKSRSFFAREVALVGIMAALSNALAFVALPGPLNIQFGMTAIPILLVSFSLGPWWGAVCGLIGGIIQAQKYGHILYIFYTAIQGFVAGYFALKPIATRKVAPLFALIGGFFLVFWVDILRNSNFTLTHLSETSFKDAPNIFGMSINVPLPLIGIIGGVILFSFTILLVRKNVDHFSILHLLLAGSYGAIAYVPYDAFVLYVMQGYPWLPTWFVLSKDLVQDFIAAALCAAIIQNRRISNLLLSPTSADI
jgi:thiamine transporter ThiT